MLGRADQAATAKTTAGYPRFPRLPMPLCGLVQRYIDFLGGANAPISFGVSPLKGFGLFVVATDVADEFPIEIFNRDEDAASDYISLDFGKPGLNLVEPGGVGWCVMDANISISPQEFPDLGDTMSREIIGARREKCWRVEPELGAEAWLGPCARRSF